MGDFWNIAALILFPLGVVISTLASAHVVLHKRDTRAAIAWVGIIWLSPFFGTVLYVLFGVNRIMRKAGRLRARRPKWPSAGRVVVESLDTLGTSLGPYGDNLETLARLVGQTTDLPLYSGNRIEPLVNGAEAYPAMLAAIDRAQKSISLTTYIFDNDPSGRMFAEALGRAVQRGVKVCVIVDDVGRRYSWTPIVGRLEEADVHVARFLPTFVLGHFRYANLRNHRKIMVVDGRHGFTGGMNIRHGNTLEATAAHPIQDLHFQVEGPVVSQMQEVFAQDWHFCTSEALTGEAWFPPLESVGPILARGIPDGPDQTPEKLRLTKLGALACAQRSVMILTPYFIPDDALLTALNVAALRGVQVDIVIPRANNLRLMQWGMLPTVRMILDSGCRVWRSAPPFDHSKLMVVDGAWSLVGSANWDTRSLRLNFEFDVEAYDRHLATRLEQIAREKITHSQPLSVQDIDGRNVLWRLRDGIARLGAPYL